MGIFARAAKQLPGTIDLGGMGTWDVGSSIFKRIGIDFGQRSAASVSVSHERAMLLPAYSTAIRVLAEDVGKTPLMTYRRTDKGKERAPEHPSYGVLHDAPNPYMTAMTFKGTLTAHYLGWGDGYASMVADGQGRVTAMWPLRPDRTQPAIDDTTGRLVYIVQLRSGEERQLERSEVFHIPGLSFDGISGYPVLTSVMRESVGLALAQQEWVSQFYANDASPGIYMKAPGKLSDNAVRHLSETWNAHHRGLTDAHRLGILEEGLDIGKIGVSPQEQQLLDSRKWSATEIGGMFRLPPWKIGVYDRATWGNVEDGNIDYLVSCLSAHFARWDQQVNLQVYGVGSQTFGEHLVESWLQGNMASQAVFFRTMRDASAMTPDEIRDRINLNRRGGAADDLFAPLNMGALSSLVSPQPPQPSPAPSGNGQHPGGTP
jgi:HK97 family phage portal protein